MSDTNHRNPVMSVRVGQLTRTQLDELCARWGMSLATLITLLVDRAYREDTGMMDQQTYPTRKAAQKVIETMRGWDAKPVQLVLPDSPHADADGNAWCIQCDGNKYMRADGFIR